MTSLFNPQSTTSLILAGGGMRLAYHAGVLQALEEAQLSFNHVDGTSGGIFNTAQLASGLDVQTIQKKWRNLSPMAFMSTLPIGQYLSIGRLPAMGDADGIRSKVFPALGIDIHKINSQQAIRTSYNVCNFSSKEIESIDGGHVTENHLIAGMSLPIFMPAIKIDDQWYTDAVWVKDANLMDAVKNGAQKLYLVYCIGNTGEYLDGSFLQYVHMIEMSAAGGLLAEFDWLSLLNRQISAGQPAYGQSRPVELFVIKPRYPLPLDPDLFFGKISFRTLINMGYAHAKAQIEAPAQPLSYQATLMLEPGYSFQLPCIFENARYQLFLHFDFRILPNGQFAKDCYGSLLDKQTAMEYPLFDLVLENSKGLYLNAKFMKDNLTHALQVHIAMIQKAELLLGLDFKTATMHLNNQAEELLHQSIATRLKAVWQHKTYANVGWFSKLKIRDRILSQLYGQ